jgi:hypothetical protein
MYQELALPHTFLVGNHSLRMVLKATTCASPLGQTRLSALASLVSCWVLSHHTVEST